MSRVSDAPEAVCRAAEVLRAGTELSLAGEGAAVQCLPWPCGSWERPLLSCPGRLSSLREPEKS